MSELNTTVSRSNPAKPYLPGGRELFAFGQLRLLLLAGLGVLFAGTTLPIATRTILFGLVVLFAVMALREKRA